MWGRSVDPIFGPLSDHILIRLMESPSLTAAMSEWETVPTMLIDLHAHTSLHSLDCSVTPDELIEGAKAVGLDGICITEHDQFWSRDAAAELAKRHDFLVIPGCEITTEEGHILTFGLERYVFGMHRAGFLKARVEEAGGALLFAHPYRRQFNPETGPEVPSFEEQVRRACENGGLDLTHGVETVNGRGSVAQNRFSLAVSEQLGLPAFGASDTHDPEDMGACATEFDRKVAGLDDFIVEVLAKRYHPVVMRNSLGPTSSQPE